MEVILLFLFQPVSCSSIDTDIQITNLIQNNDVWVSQFFFVLSH